MLAAVLHGRHDLRIEDVPEPSISSKSQIKVRVTACGICGSDLHLFNGGGAARRDSDEPIRLGHEASGVVVDVGCSVDQLKPGNLVGIDPSVPCGACRFCLEGRPNLCKAVRFIGTEPALPGGMAEYVVVEAERAHVLPDDLSAHAGALVEPLSVAMHAVKLSGACAEDTVAVLGAGLIGAGVTLILTTRGVGTSVLVEPARARRLAMEGIGAVVLDPGSAEIRSQVRQALGGDASLVFNAAGVPESFELTQSILSRGGTGVLVALGEKTLPLNGNVMVFKEQVFRGSVAHQPDDFRDVVTAIEALTSPLMPLVDVVSLADIVDRGFAPLRSGQAFKVLIDPSSRATHPGESGESLR